MKIVLYVMNKKGLNTLEALCAKFTTTIIKAVIASRDQNVKNDYYDEIKSFCKNYSIKFINRVNDNDEFINNYRLAIGWRWIIPSSNNLIIFHDSLLPKYRGFSPLVNALINGEREIGVTALFASEEYDKGNIIAQKHLSISYPISIQEAISKIAPLYEKLAIEVVNDLLKKILNSVTQNEDEATYSIWRDEEDYHINWKDSSENIIRFINAVSYPYLGAYSYVNNQKIRILEAESYVDLNLELRHIGKVILLDEGYPIVTAGKGLVKITKMLNSDNEDILPLKKFRTRFK